MNNLSKGLITDDMDISDTTLSMSVWWNGDYYLSLQETRDDIGEIIKLTTRISMSWGVASIAVKSAIAQLYQALEQQEKEGL